MPDRVLKFPVNDEARERLEARKTTQRRRRSRAAVMMGRSPEVDDRISADERRRAAPEAFMLWALISVFVLTIAPVGLLAVVGY